MAPPIKHGHTINRKASSTYRVWQALIKRCTDTEGKYYKDYGGRGINVHDLWLKDFKYFLADMGESPFPGAQLDRINNNDDYYTDNCRWVSAAENSRNRRSCQINMEKANEIKKAVQELKDKHGKLPYGSGPELMMRFGVSLNIIRDIARGKTWNEAS